MLKASKVGTTQLLNWKYLINEKAGMISDHSRLI